MSEAKPQGSTLHYDVADMLYVFTKQDGSEIRLTMEEWRHLSKVINEDLFLRYDNLKRWRESRQRQDEK